MPTTQNPRRPLIVDVHHHVFPPEFMESWATAPGATDDYVLAFGRKWDPSWMYEEMDRCGVHAAVMSISDQRASLDYLSIDDHRLLARRCNDYGARLSKDHPGRLGLFAFVPMPDVEGSLIEVEYALDTLGAAGVGLMTNYIDRWVGDPGFFPLLEELNRRKAVAFCHPRAPGATRNLIPHMPPAFASPLELPFDTGRAVVTLLMSGALARFPDIRWIFNHGGAVIPALSGRLRLTVPNMLAGRDLEDIAPGGVDAMLQRLHWDTAARVCSPQMKALLDYVPLENIMFGSDYPLVETRLTLGDLAALDLTPVQDIAIKQDNALRLFPQFAPR